MERQWRWSSEETRQATLDRGPLVDSLYAWIEWRAFELDRRARSIPAVSCGARLLQQQALQGEFASRNQEPYDQRNDQQN